ncbi:transmembrane protein 194 [Tanacetum coccineum]
MTKTEQDNTFYCKVANNAERKDLLGIDVGNPRVHVTPVFMNGVSEFCGRVPVSGVSRLKLQHYASAYNVTLVPSVLMPKKWHSKIQVCFHGNSSVGLCQCEKDDWRSLQDGFWSSFMSPYERKYVDVKFGDKVTGSVTVGVDEVISQHYWKCQDFNSMVSGIAKIFVGELVETAGMVMTERKETGPIRPCHIREAYIRLKLEGKIPKKSVSRLFR